MACELLLEGLLDGTIHRSVISNAFESLSAIKAGSSVVNLSEFIPYFLEYIHTKLSPISSDGPGNIYRSPRQKQLKKSLVNVTNPKRKDKKNICISLNYSSSSPAKPVRSEPCNNFNGISPIKKPTYSGNKNSRRQKTTVLKHSSFENTTHSFELSSFDDFPSISSLSTSKSKNPRRITATQVSKNHSSGKENSFLEESSFEVNSSENTDFSKVFSDSSRFINGNKNDEKHFFGCSTDNGFGNVFDDAFSRLNLVHDATPCESKSEVNRLCKNGLSKESVSISNVKNKEAIDILLFIYFMIFSRNAISNYAVEFHFLFAALVYPTSTTIATPFDNVSGCVYFVCECLKQFKNIVSLFDVRTSVLLRENNRIQEFIDQETISYFEQNFKKEKHNHCFDRFSIKSPRTGIPFQVDYDNRKSFESDQLFYLFSKKRDLFYGLIRQWEQNRYDPDWDMKLVLKKHVLDIMRSDGSSKIFYPLARLFVAQLLEMCRNSFGNKDDKKEENKQGDSVILELKTKNPSKFQSLQSRFTKPSLTTDPCPKPGFTDEEHFFKEFISIADSYIFNKCLIHIIIKHIETLNAQSFGLDDSFQLNRSDIADSIWYEIKSSITDLRLLGKFLGFILFLPFHNNLTSNMFSDVNQDCMIIESIDMSPFIKNAVHNSRLIVTIPWIVEFFSMADKNIFKYKLFEKPFWLLIKLYAELNFQTQIFSVLYLALIVHIGWLLEQYQIDSLDFFKIILDKESILNVGRSSVGIDFIVDVDKMFLYELCPYLNDIKKPLLDYAKGINASNPGSYRKITTLKTSDVVFTDPSTNVRLQLIDSFTRHLPTHISDLLKFLTERHFSNIKTMFTSRIFHDCAKDVVEKMKPLLKVDDITTEESLDLSTLQLVNQSIYSEVLSKSLDDVTENCSNSLKRYLEMNIEMSIKSLLPETTSCQLIDTSVKVIKHNLRNKVQEWFQLNKETYTELVDSIFQRYLKSIVKNKLDISRSCHYENIV